MSKLNVVIPVVVISSYTVLLLLLPFWAGAQIAVPVLFPLALLVLSLRTPADLGLLLLFLVGIAPPFRTTFFPTWLSISGLPKLLDSVAVLLTPLNFSQTQSQKNGITFLA
jgi:hypothetical protein